MTDLSNPTDPAVLDALTRTCCICQVDPDECGCGDE